LALREQLFAERSVRRRSEVSISVAILPDFRGPPTSFPGWCLEERDREIRLLFCV